MSQTDHGPSIHPVIVNDDVLEWGMPLRDYFAAQALTGTLSSPQWAQVAGGPNVDPGTAPAILAKIAYEIADAMLAERSKVS